MGYCTLAQVQARIPTQLLELGSTSQPSAAEVEGWIESTSAWIDGTLAHRYGVPVTNAADLALLAPICAALVASRCWGTLSGHSGEMAANGPDLRKEALTLLAYDAKTGHANLVLTGTAASASGEAEVGIPEGTFSDPDTADSVDAIHPRFFSVGMDF